MAAGIGIFISFVGLQGGGIIVSSKSSLVELGSLTVPRKLPIRRLRQQPTSLDQSLLART